MRRHLACALFLLALFTYAHDIAPILNAHCVECHSVGAPLNLTAFPFFSSVSADQLTIVGRMLLYAGGSDPMMPPGNRPKLTPAQLNVIQQWRDAGLHY